MNRTPSAKSIGEETFLLHCRAYGLEPVREYQFTPTRKFKFDFAWPDKMLAVEVEGGTRFGLSRHSQGDGFERDCVKYNLAALEGWKVFRFTTRMVHSGEAINAVRAALSDVEAVLG